MNYLNYDSAAEHFMRITGISGEDFSHTALLDNAENFVLSHLAVSPEKLSESELALCEYAAAAVAVYDYAFELCLKDRPVMSENGAVSMQRADSALIERAKSLRNSALEQLAAAGLAKPCDFAFVGV